MSNINYIEIISSNFPNVGCHISGDPTIYENIVWDAGDPLPSKTTLDDLSIDTEQKKVWELIKKVRDIKYAGGVFVSGKWFHTDPDSRIKYIGLVLLGANMPGNIQWKTMDGTFVPMTSILIQSVFGAIVVNDGAIFTQGEIHKAAMMAAQNPEAYDYTTGWPSIYSE